MGMTIFERGCCQSLSLTGRRGTMAAHIDTGTMVTPNYRSQTLDHLGLVAGMFDEVGIGEVLDQVIPQDRTQRRVSVGQAVKAMVLNGRGFVNRTLYPTFRTPPTVVHEYSCW